MDKKSHDELHSFSNAIQYLEAVAHFAKKAADTLREHYDKISKEEFNKDVMKDVEG